MGIAELDKENATLNISAQIIIYGDAANPPLAQQIAMEIGEYWNAPSASVSIKGVLYKIIFHISGQHNPALQPDDVFYNDDPRLNFFRVEEYSEIDISFVDGIGCNTGYFKLANLLNNSTTAAHEFGHTIGLEHPHDLDIRGVGTPGIMYPRGTLVDPHFQYDPDALPRAVGGTINPTHRKVLLQDIEDLHLDKLSYNKDGRAILGDFSSIWHHKHLK